MKKLVVYKHAIIEVEAEPLQDYPNFFTFEKDGWFLCKMDGCAINFGYGKTREDAIAKAETRTTNIWELQAAKLKHEELLAQWKEGSVENE
jgi:hypothetical protein